MNHLGTAGKPILGILEKNNIFNVLVVVIRYFGGILLGTGGLVKAYSDTTTLALQNSKIINIEPGYEVNIVINYQDIELIKYFCKTNNVNILKEEYLEKVMISVDISKDKFANLNKFCSQNNIFSKITIISEKYIKNP